MLTGIASLPLSAAQHRELLRLEILSPFNFVIQWNGGDRGDDIKIRSSTERV
jgi:hypothetical protein